MLGTRNRSLGVLLSGIALTALLLLVASGCGGSSSSEASGGDGSGGKLTLVAYSTPEEASPTRPRASSRAPWRAAWRQTSWSSRSSRT